MSLVDQPARDAIRTALDRTLVVEAAAGTGKTTELVGRILALLRTGRAELSNVVAVTFTEKAAGEMKLRLRAEIDRARRAASDEESGRLDRSLSQLETAHIGTIHAFCAELLRERPIEAKVDPLFVAADESTQERLFDLAFDRWFSGVLSDPPEGVRRVLRKRGRDREGGGPKAILRRAGLSLVGQRDFDHPWRRDPFAREREIDRVLGELSEVAALLERTKDKDSWFGKSLQEIARATGEVERRERLAQAARDYDGVEEELRKLSKERHWNWKGGRRDFAPGLSKDAAVAQRDAAKASLDALLRRADADLAACLFSDLQVLVRAYTALKDESGKIDFLDLLLRARDLIVHDRAVRGELQRKYTHILVDEFQDTDPLQAEILVLLACDDADETDYRKARVTPGKLFVVGDPKQSIYRFRRADVVLYERIKRKLVQDGATLLHLRTSFRAVPSIQRAVNGAFERAMKPNDEGSQAEYVALEPFREDVTTQPAVIALPVPKPYSPNSGKVSSYWIEQSIPDAVGALVSWLTSKSGWTVAGKDGGAREPVAAKHICLLFRRFVSFGDDVTRPYVRALEQRRVPHVLVGGKSLYQREEVVALKNGLSAIEWPDDELSVFATLKGPLFALADDALLAYRARHGSLSPVRRVARPMTELTAPVQDALDVLRELHTRRNQRPVADTITELLDRTRAHAGIAIWPTGEQALANVLRLTDDARRFEASGATSFRAFVYRLEDAEERGGAAEAPVVEEGTDGVRIMTVHKAKGLEFPIVILVDPSCPLTQREPSRYVDADKRLWVAPLAGAAPVELSEQRERMLKQDEEEAVRLLYVATTRAKDLLVVPAVGDERAEGWVSPFHPALYPRHLDRRSARAAPGCPPFGDDSVLERPDKTEADRHRSVHPGLHVPDAGSHEVVWWDPRALDSSGSRDVGLRQARVLSADEAGGKDRKGEEEHGAWKAEHARALERGAVATHRIRTVTGVREHVTSDETIAVSHETTGAAREDRPRGKAFGVLVHAVLASVPLDADEGAVLRIAEAEGRILGATAHEVEHAARAARHALDHPIFKAARASEARRESPISLRDQDGAITIGVLDLAYREGDAWVVVDFKTDAELGARREAYEAQVRTYARAVSVATGMPARAVLLSV